ncbi:MAG: leucine-rich repeat domain-containing protein [Lachnospiraceae bacterium]|nr:leucine-rich repeat domain-containing protein [Lachnospiraceae bacterium]
MSWIKGKKRGQSVFAAAFVLLGIWAVVAVRGSAATANVVDGFVLNKTGTAVMSYEGDGGDIVIPDGVKTIAAGAFLGNKKVTGVDLNDVRTVGNNAFAKSALETVEGGDLLRAVGGNAFAETKLTEFEVPDGLLRLAQDAFSGTKTLTSFSGGSDNYQIVGNCIYTDDGDELYISPGGRTHAATVTASKRATKKASASDGATAGASKKVANTSAVAVTDIEEIAGGGLEGPDPLAEYEANSQIAAELDKEELSEDADYEEEFDEDEEEYDEGIDWVDPELLAQSGRYAAVEHSLDTYDVNGGTSSSTSNSATTDAANSAANSGSSAGSTSGSTAASANASSGSVSNETVARARDATPKTADGDIDPKFVFCLALFLVGLAGLIFVRQRSMVQIAASRSVADNGELD